MMYDLINHQPQTPAGERWRTARTPRSARADNDGAAASSGTAPALTPGALSNGHVISEDEPGEKLTIWGTNIDMNQVGRKIDGFLRHFTDQDAISRDERGKYEELIFEALRDGHNTIHIDCNDVFAWSTELHDQLVAYPTEIVPHFDMVIFQIAQEMVEKLGVGRGQTPYLQIRPFAMRVHRPMRDLNPTDIDKLVSVKGMVTRCSGVVPDLRTAFFRCTLCGNTQTVLNDNGHVAEPTQCGNCENQFTMELLHNRSQFSSKQLVKIQEAPEAIPEGETPHTITMYVHDDLVDSVKPGDRVEVVGVFCAVGMRVNQRVRSLRCVYKTFVDAIHVRKESAAASGLQQVAEKGGGIEDAQAMLIEALRREGTDLSEEKIRAKEEALRAVADNDDLYETLVRSLAPSIFGMDDVKKGVLCQLFGGCSKAVPGGRIRGDINCLLVGDPGVSKSQLLSYVHQVAPRGIYTSGRGSSAVGLTAYVTKDPETRDMVLESGALVLSDLGVCCIDEFDKMSDSARSVLHEVMEQQTVSVAKAGIISTLNARTSVLAAANPVGSRYDRKKSIVENLQLPPTLLSRFDLIYLLLDKNDEWEDRRLARHLTSLHYDAAPEKLAPPLSKDKLRDYIAYARAVCHPVLTDESCKELVTAYVEMRRTGYEQGVQSRRVTATARQLDSLVRLSEGLARMELRPDVEPRHVKEAVRLVKAALMESATDKYGRIDMDLITGGYGQAQRDELVEVGQSLLGLLKASVPTSRSDLYKGINANAEPGRGVSRAIVDEAIKLLQLDGQIDVRQNGIRLTTL